jgi:hypothetical protein
VVIHKVRDGRFYFAEVVLAVDSAVAYLEIVFECSGKGFLGQGSIEDVPASGYEDWRAGARAGVSFALAAVGATTARVVVQRISGLSTDTNPTVVAVAAAHAVWNGLGVSPPSAASAQLERMMFSSGLRPADEVPSFT